METLIAILIAIRFKPGSKRRLLFVFNSHPDWLVVYVAAMAVKKLVDSKEKAMSKIRHGFVERRTRGSNPQPLRATDFESAC